MLGYSAQEMVGKTPGILHLPAEVDARGKELSEEFGRPVEGFDVFVTHAREGRFEEREWTYVRKGGSHLTVNLVVTDVRDEDGRITGFLGVAQDITARKRAEEAALLEQRRTEMLLGLSQTSNRPEEESIATAVEAAISLTGSGVGYFATLDESESVLTMRYWSKSAHAQCQVRDKPIIYPVAHTGLWGEAVRQRKPIITNDYAAPNPLKHGTPEGHVPVVRHMNIPVFFDNRMVAVAGVGNKSSDYNESDVRQLQIFMNGLCSILHRKQAEAALHESEARHRTLFDQSRDPMITMAPPSWRFSAGAKKGGGIDLRPNSAVI
jgi:PAS domain S-box-containing protein